MKTFEAFVLTLFAASLCGPAYAANPMISGAPDGQGQFEPAQPVIPDRDFRLGDFGAVADRRTLNTGAFRKAIAAVDQAGGGRLVVPAGIYLTGPIELCSRIDLHLEAGAVIVFAAPDKFSYDGWLLPPLLQAKDSHDVQISGDGIIYGTGEAWWPAVHKAMHHQGRQPARPFLVMFDSCARVRVQGVILTHAPMFNLVPTHCRDVTIDGVSIINPAPDYGTDDGVPLAEFQRRMMAAFDAEAPNTDGIDPMVCQRVLITHCLIDTGDDCIAVKANEGGVTEDVLITDCTFLHGHGCTVGSGSVGGLRNLMVQRCTFRGTEAGVNLESARDRGSAVMENITYRDLTMDHVGVAIGFGDYYPAGSRPYRSGAASIIAAGGHQPPQAITSTTPCWRHVSIINVKATCYWEAGMILGLPEMPIRDLILDHVEVEAPWGLTVSYAQNLTLQDVHVRAQHGPGLILHDTVSGVSQ